MKYVLVITTDDNLPFDDSIEEVSRIVNGLLRNYPYGEITCQPLSEVMSA